MAGGFENMEYYAAIDIKSGNRTIYAKQGDPVLVVYKNSDVWICETQSGNRFPAHKRKITTAVITPIITNAAVKEKPISKKPLTQAEKIQLEYLNSLKK